MSHNSNSVARDLNLHRWVQKHVQYWEHFEIRMKYVFYDAANSFISTFRPSFFNFGFVISRKKGEKMIK